MNILINWILRKKLLRENPVIKGNQWINLAIIANTAPMDNT